MRDTKIRKVVEKYCWAAAAGGCAKIREMGAEKFPYLYHFSRPTLSLFIAVSLKLSRRRRRPPGRERERDTERGTFHILQPAESPIKLFDTLLLEMGIFGAI